MQSALQTDPSGSTPAGARRKGAGIMFTTADGKALFLRRAGDSEHAGTWAWPGGHVEDGETPETAARREVVEETGMLPKWELDRIGATDDEGEGGEEGEGEQDPVDFTTFGQQVEQEFIPQLNSEHDAYMWAPLRDAPRPLHPGVHRLLMTRTAYPQVLSTGGWDAALSSAIQDFKIEEMREPTAAEREKISLQARRTADINAALESGMPSAREFCHRHGSDGKARGEESRIEQNQPEGADVKPNPRDLAATDSALRLALDRESVREVDPDGRMRVAVANISKANICPYRGCEIPEYEALGLDPDKVYNLLRDPDELAKAAPTFNGVQILRQHTPVSAEDHQPWEVVGTTGTNARFEDPYLRNSLSIWSKEAIDAIESEEKRELSCGYHYRADMTPGNFDGKPFDGVMRDIVGNHVALVEDGRAGPDVVVGDSSEGFMDNRDLAKKFNALAARQVSIGALVTYLKPRLAQDAKMIDLPKVFGGVKVGPDFKNQKTKIAERIRGQAKDKLAKDTTLDDVEKVLDMLESHEVDGGDESVSEPQHKAMEAAANGASTLEIPAAVGKEFADADKGKASFDAEPVKGFLREKGMSEDDIAHVAGMFPKPATDEDPESEEAKKKREDEEKKKAEDKAAADKAAKDAEMDKDKDKVTKTAMDAAIKVATEATAKQVRDTVMKTHQQIREALAEVRPWVGELPVALAFDSAEQVRRHALGMLGIDGAKTMHADALGAVLKVQPKPGTRAPGERETIALDAASSKNLAEKYPGMARIGLG